MRGLGCIFILLLAVVCCPVEGSDYYVATGGSDGDPGTSIGSPFATIQHAADVMDPGDTCYIRGGTYREAVTISDANGLVGSSFTFTNYNGEYVRISGTMAITSGWSVHSGSIYKTTIGTDIWQLFIDDKIQIPARWPNITSNYWDVADDSSGWDPTSGSYWDQDDWVDDGNGTWARASAVTPSGLTNDDSKHDLSVEGVSFQGGVMVGMRKYASGQDVFHETITSHTAGSDTFVHTNYTYAVDARQKHTADEARYFIVADIDALDSPGEWFYDKATGWLYVWCFDGGSPAGRAIEGRTEGHILTLLDCNYMNFSGIHFYSGATYLSGTTHTNFDECRFSYPSVTKTMLGELHAVNPPAKNETHNADPANLSWTNCWFEYSEGRAIAMRTFGNLIENCYFRNCCWGPTTFGVVSDKKGGNTIYRRNTIESTGRSNGSKNGPGATIEYCLYNKFYFRGDSSGFQIPAGTQSTTVSHHNWNLRAFNRNGVRFDGDPAGYYGTIYKTVSSLANKGFRLKGDYHEIYNLTGIFNQDNDINIAQDKGGNASTVSGNLAGQVVFVIAGTNHTSWFGLSEGEQLADHLRDPVNYDFRPKAGSPLVDTGTHFPGFTDGYVGSSPDIGAYEYGKSNYWIPGCKFKKASFAIPPDGALGVKLDADLMWREGRDAVSHDVYFGTDSGSLAAYPGRTTNIFSPGGLGVDTVYYWRVDVVTAGGTVTGDLWSFDTTPLAGGGSSTFTVTDDSHTTANNPDAINGLAGYINLKSSNGSRGWLQFDVTGISDPVQSATVRLRTKPSSDRLPSETTIYDVNDNDWDQLTITHNNAPDVGGVLFVNSGPFTINTWFDFDVTAAVSGNGTYSFALTDIGTNKVRYESMEAGFAAQLVIMTAVNNAPNFNGTTFSKPYGTAGSAYSGSIADEAYDLEDDELTFSKELGPGWLGVAANGDLSGTPGGGDMGANVFVVRVEDPSGGFDESTMNISVHGSPDINADGDINYGDFAIISAYFVGGCVGPGWCGGADLNVSGSVDPNDVKTLAESWLGLP